MTKNSNIWRCLAVLLLLLAVVAAGYQGWLVQRSFAAMATSTLLKVSVAENRYAEKHHVYTDNWLALFPLIDQNVHGKFLDPEGIERRWWVELPANYFTFHLQMSPDQKSARILVVRTGLLAYVLQDEVPTPNFACIGHNKPGRIFCDYFSKYMADYMLLPTKKEI